MEKESNGRIVWKGKAILLYFYLAIFFTVLFNIQGIMKYGFFEWGVLDGMVAAVKGILWIIFIWI